jgi:hypothetical protein
MVPGQALAATWHPGAGLRTASGISLDQALRSRLPRKRVALVRFRADSIGCVTCTHVLPKSGGRDVLTPLRIRVCDRG